jgi:glutamine synthetase
MVFDGSSTKQAEGGSSDCGTRIYPDPTRINGYLVMTEVMHADGTPHSSNGRATIDDDGVSGLDLNKSISLWILKHCCHFLLEVILPEGMYYCSVGGKNTHGRALVESMPTYVLLD